METIGRRQMITWLGFGCAAGLGAIAGSSPLSAQTRTRLSIATGGTGGVYYPLGGGMAAVISKHLPGVEATAEVTAAGVDNMKLLHADKVALALSLSDVVWDAYQGKLRGLPEKVGVRTLAVVYSSHMHLVTTQASGIRQVTDLKGKRVSTGAPGSGGEVKSLRIFEAYGLSTKDLGSQERLGVTESVGAMKDRKIDAFVWDGGLPTAAILDLAATPGIKVHLIPHADSVPRMVAKYGPLYFAGVIPRGTYPGVDEDATTAASSNLLVAHERMPEPLAYDITKLLLERTPELVAVHKAAQELTVRSAVVGSPVPFHPGAARYYTEKGVKIPAS